MKKISSLVLLTALLMACGGGGATVQSSNTTKGQELIDLKKALDEGIINQEEYEDAKETIIERE